MKFSFNDTKEFLMDLMIARDRLGGFPIQVVESGLGIIEVLMWQQIGHIQAKAYLKNI